MTAGQDLAHVQHFLDPNNSFLFAAVARAHAAVRWLEKWRGEVIYQNDEVGGKQLLSFTEIPAGLSCLKKVKNVELN